MAPLSPCVHDAFEAWLLHMKEVRRRAPLTLENYRRYVGECLRILDDIAGMRHTVEQLGQVDIALFRAWAARLHARDLSARSYAAALSAVRGFFSFLERRGMIDDAAVFSLRAPRRPRLLPKPAVQADIFRLLNDWKDAFPDDDPAIIARDIALCALLYGTGLRISEALSLNADSITRTTTLFYVTGKRNKERRVPLIRPVREYILAYKDVTGMSDSANMPLFRGVRGGRLHRSAAARRLQIARRILGADERFTPHALRHAFASDLLAEGGELRVIQELLGHASVGATQIYTKVSDRARRDALMRFHPRGPG